MIEVESVGKAFAGRPAVEGLSLTVERGEETLELDLPHYPRKTRGENPLGGWMYISDD